VEEIQTRIQSAVNEVSARELGRKIHGKIREVSLSLSKSKSTSIHKYDCSRGYKFTLSVPLFLHTVFFQVQPNPRCTAAVLRGGREVATGSIASVADVSGWCQSNFVEPFLLQSGDAIMCQNYLSMNFTVGESPLLRVVTPEIKVVGQYSDFQENAYNLEMKIFVSEP
jgi:hypothetical protein